MMILLYEHPPPLSGTVSSVGALVAVNVQLQYSVEVGADGGEETTTHPPFSDAPAILCTNSDARKICLLPKFLSSPWRKGAPKPLVSFNLPVVKHYHTFLVIMMPCSPHNPAVKRSVGQANESRHIIGMIALCVTWYITPKQPDR